MTSQEFTELLSQGESQTLEFKTSLDKGAFETVAAFANTRGGMLCIGVRNDGTPTGVEVGKETLRNWANRIAQATGVHADMTVQTVDGKTIVVIEVDESQLKPVTCRGRAFRRVNDSTRQMSDEDLTRTVLEKVGMTWDEVVEPRASLEDLDSEQLHRFRTFCNQKGRRRIPAQDDDVTMLRKLGLLDNGQLLRAAVLLFGNSPQRFYLSAQVKVGRFRSPTHIVDDREIAGTLFDQVEGTMDYFRQHLQTRFEFSGQPARDVIWEYPLEALREAVTNAVIHRDYLETAHTQVRWYDDHLLILNPGELLPPLSTESLKREHLSRLRNRKIAEMFFYAGWIEQWGSGTLKMVRECTEAGLPEPEFEEQQGGLWLTFRKDIFSEDYLRSLELNERQVKAVLYVKENGRITNTEYQQLCDVSKRTASEDLATLEAGRLLERVGTTGRGTHYRLMEETLRGETGNQGAIKGQNVP